MERTFTDPVLSYLVHDLTRSYCMLLSCVFVVGNGFASSEPLNVGNICIGTLRDVFSGLRLCLPASGNSV